MFNGVFLSQDVPLLHTAVDLNGGTLNVKDVNIYGGKGHLEGFAEATGDTTLGGFNSSTLTAENMHRYNQYNQFSEGKFDYMDSRVTTGQEHLYSGYKGGAFDGMALSDQFLGEYYFSVSIMKDHR